MTVDDGGDKRFRNFITTLSTILIPSQAVKVMVGRNLKDTQLQQVVDKVFQWNEKDCSELISFEEFCIMAGNADSHHKLSFQF